MADKLNNKLLKYIPLSFTSSLIMPCLFLLRPNSLYLVCLHYLLVYCAFFDLFRHQSERLIYSSTTPCLSSSRTRLSVLCHILSERIVDLDIKPSHASTPTSGLFAADRFGWWRRLYMGCAVCSHSNESPKDNVFKKESTCWALQNISHVLLLRMMCLTVIICLAGIMCCCSVHSRNKHRILE